MSLLQMQNVSYEYSENHKKVLSGVDMDFEAGKFYAIVGNSGAGKSTLIKTILKLSVPVTIGSLVSIVHTMIDTITVTNGIQKAYMHIYTAKDVLESKATEMKGILSKVSTIVGLPQSITIAIAIAIVPVVSVLVARGERQKAKERIERAINLSVIIIMPAIVGLFVLSEPLLKLMYPRASEGGVLMQILCVATVFMCLSHTIRKWTSRYPVML